MTHIGKEIQIRKAIGLQIKLQLRANFITQAKAAELSALTPLQVSSIVNGTRNYTMDTLTKLVEACNLDLELNTQIFETFKQKYGL